jgi:hypothetical protein
MLRVGKPSRDEKEKVAEKAPGVDDTVCTVQARVGLEQKYVLIENVLLDLVAYFVCDTSHRSKEPPDSSQVVFRIALSMSSQRK